MKTVLEMKSKSQLIFYLSNLVTFCSLAVVLILCQFSGSLLHLTVRESLIAWVIAPRETDGSAKTGSHLPSGGGAPVQC